MGSAANHLPASRLDQTAPPYPGLPKGSAWLRTHGLCRGNTIWELGTDSEGGKATPHPPPLTHSRSMSCHPPCASPMLEAPAWWHMGAHPSSCPTASPGLLELPQLGRLGRSQAGSFPLHPLLLSNTAPQQLRCPCGCCICFPSLLSPTTWPWRAEGRAWVLGLFLIGLQHGAGDQAGPLGREALFGGAAGRGDPPQPPQFCLPGPDSTHTWCSRLMPILSKVWMRHMGLQGFVVGSLYTSPGCFSVGGGSVASVCFWVARLCACVFPVCV